MVSFYSFPFPVQRVVLFATKNAYGNWLGTSLRARNLKKLKVFEGLKHHLARS